MSKVFEVLVKKQLLDFCLAEQAIPDSQFGFLPGRSTTWQLLSVIDDWQRALDAGHAVHALLLDVAKAFDRVNHAILLGNCRSLGISRLSMNWIESYLSARVIVTSVDSQLSSPQSISSGVSQGSVLGPLFFLLYFSSLPAAVQACTPMLFADDTLVCNTSF